jgi:hypothetical protein
MTRNGKIAHLPRHLRDQLNQRLEDGEQAKSLAKWLNTLDEVRSVLDTHFASRPISEQNLSEWKNGGFLDWQHRQETDQRIQRLLDLTPPSDAIDEDDDTPQTLPDRLAAALTAELAATIQHLLEITTDPLQRWKHIREALRQIHQLRRGDQRAALTGIKIARWNLEAKKAEEEQEKQFMADAVEEILAPITDATTRPALAKAYGGGENGERVADFILEIRRKYRPSHRRLDPLDRPRFTPSDQTQSK